MTTFATQQGQGHEAGGQHDEAADLLEAALAVYLLAVDPVGRGPGSRLLVAVLDPAGADRAWLVTTDMDSPAMRLYRK